MTLVERHAYKPADKDFAELDHICFLSKNLYNSTLYAVRQHFFETHEHLNYNRVNADFTHNDQPDYRALPTKVSKLTQQLVDRSFKSFFGLLKAKQKGKLAADYKVRIPKYLDKIKGRQVVEYTKQALSFVKPGFIRLSGTEIRIPSNRTNVRFVRVVPKDSRLIMVEVGYEQQVEYKKTGNTAAIDIGVNNLAAVTSNSFEPLIVNGRPLKSINQFYSKRLAELKSRQDLSGSKRKNTNRISALTRKRNAKVDDYLHKASREITNHLAANNVKTLVIGYNKGWKQDVNLGRVNNQIFVQIPFLRFIQKLTYKCALLGISVETRTEAHTSKCSFLDDEVVKKHLIYMGKRVKRGLFKSSNGTFINADVNAAYNILKQYLHENGAWNLEVFRDCVEVCSTPAVFTVKL